MVFEKLCFLYVVSSTQNEMPAFSNSFGLKIIFKNLLFQIVLRPHENAQPAFSNSSGLKSVLKRFRFHDRLRMDGRPNQRSKAAFLRCSVWGLKYSGSRKLYEVLFMGLWLWISWLLLSKHFFARFLVFNWWPTHVLFLHTLHSCRNGWN